MIILDPETGTASDGSRWIRRPVVIEPAPPLDFRTTIERMGKCTCTDPNTGVPKGTCGTCCAGRIPAAGK